MNNKAHDIIMNMVYVALFAAMAFVGTFVHINFGAAIGMIHLGNFVGILAALLFGGLVGGLSGALGMGLYDILYGYAWDTIVRTFIVKFVAFFLIGILFDIFSRKNEKKKILPLILFVIFIALGSLLMYFYFGMDNEKLHTVLVLTGAIMMLSFAFYYLVIFFIKEKFNKIMYDVLLATSVGIIVQVFLEFLLRIVLLMVMGNNFTASSLTSVIKLPTALVNGTITIILIQVFFLPLYLGTVKLIKRRNNM